MGPRQLPTIVGILLIASMASPVFAAAGYQLTASDTTETPERTIDFQGRSYTLDSTVRVSPGATVTAEVSAPDEVYRVYIYNSDEQIVDQQRGTGNGSFEFTLTGYQPGSYVITTYHDGDFTTIQPLLVSGYDVSLNSPSEVNGEEKFDVTVETTKTAASESPERVRVVVAQDGTTKTYDAQLSDGTYTATIDAGEFSGGEYTVYAIVQDDKQAFGRNELMGLSDGLSLSINSGADDSTEPSDSTGSGGAQDSQQTNTATATPTETPEEETPAPTQTTTRTETETADVETRTSTATRTPSEQNGTETATETSKITTPSDFTPSQTASPSTTAGSGPGFTIGAMLCSLLVCLLLLYNRNEL